MTHKFTSQLFGEIRRATDAERADIERLAAECPADLFGAVNRRLNAAGLCITVCALDDIETKQ